MTLADLLAWFLAPLWNIGQPDAGMAPIEIVGVALGASSVYYSIRQSLWSWPTGLLNVSLYIAICWRAGMYADFGLQIVYVVLQLYGWWQWRFGGAGRTVLPVSRASWRVLAAMAAVGVASYAPMAWLLARYTDTNVPYWDSSVTVLSLLAQWMLSRKLLENWLVWMTADALYIPLWLYKGLTLTSGLYAAFLIMATIGYLTWRRNLLAMERAAADSIPPAPIDPAAT